jgi:hypothetical protein
VVLDGNACLTPQDRVPTAAQRLGENRTTMHVIDVLEHRTSWVLRALREPGTQEALEKQVRALLADLHARGALAGRGSNETFFVRVSGGPNAVVLRVGIAIVRPSQYQTYELEYCSGRIVTREIPPLDAEQLAG